MLTTFVSLWRAERPEGRPAPLEDVPLESDPEPAPPLLPVGERRARSVWFLWIWGKIFVFIWSNIIHELIT